MTDASRQPHLVATPADDGLVALYTQRALDRGADPRALAGASRALRWGNERSSTAAERSATARSVGRGTGDHRQALDASRRVRSGPVPVGRPGLTGSWQPAWSPKPGRRVAMAGIVALLALPLAALVAGAQEVAPLGNFQARYVVQPGDTLGGVAAEFGVAAEAILASSAVANAPELTPSEILVIPTPDQTPEEAVADAAARAGTSPYVLGAHSISEGETLGEIAYWNNVDPTFLAEFNGVTNVEDLRPGQRLLIPVSFGLPGPLPEAAVGGEAPVEAEPNALLAAPSADIAQELAWDPSDDVAPAEVVEEASEPIASTSIEGVPAYMQRYNLSCEYAAAYIATAAFGAGIDEDVFRANIGQSPNPHWGYRGWIEGAWGGTDD
ncbi:MAG TPA: LysM peptidoglycan-binding domain-containing protein, partial [Thermomicrobiales bacterium]|nr:LysM peptidoglycan-binding domain-containing protein [Thermomicrobiales bacterium]